MALTEFPDHEHQTLKKLRNMQLMCAALLLSENKQTRNCLDIYRYLLSRMGNPTRERYFKFQNGF